MADLPGARVLVTGGGGLIGSRITTQLRELGAHPVSICTLDAYPPHIYTDVFGINPHDPDVHTGSVTDPALMRRLVADCDYVIHAAALADVAACTRNPLAAIDTNVTGTQIVLDAVAATEGVRRLVFVSSASVYGNGDPDDWASKAPEARALAKALEFVHGGRTTPQFSEHSPLRPLSVYANTKVFGETQTALTLGAVGTSHAIVRYFSVYGEPQTIKPGSHSWVVAWFCARAALGLPLQLNGGGHQIRDLVHVDDIAHATIRTLLTPKAHQQTLNIGTATPTSIRTVAELVATHFPHTTVTETPLPPGDPLGGYASTTHLSEVLGWTPRIRLAEGIARYAAWLTATPQAIPAWLREEAAAGAR
ncbi:NAD-dependent epimerase/dehydratase family protein [Streptomyces sp. RKAG293]|uniref:NAD-dependent epimerase/dehydratase family protein n=1 Tax=Streptomyces sp. RKAG293 TaxID=2893403 RepID=UPI0027E43B28|nr:NAD-dependent epimerase/dehydratase family protein [Streptomyces sp. RKAG293]